MGMFSWSCRKCSKSILGPFSLTPRNAWMNNAVALFPNGSIVSGVYSGYGEITILVDGEDNGEVKLKDPVGLYHHACWEADGRPHYSEPSPSAKDQGHFYDDKEYDVAPPKRPRRISG